MIGSAKQEIPAVRIKKLDAFRGSRTPGSYWVDSLLNADFHTVIWFCCPCGCGEFGLTTLQNEDAPPEAFRFRLPRWNGDFKCPTVNGAVRSPCGDNLHLVAGVWNL